MGAGLLENLRNFLGSTYGEAGRVPNLINNFAGYSAVPGQSGGSADATLVSHTHTASTNNEGTHAHRVLVSQNASSNTNRIDNAANGITGEGGTDIYVLNNNNEVGQQMIESAGSHSHTVTVSTEGSSATNANLPPYVGMLPVIKY